MLLVFFEFGIITILLLVNALFSMSEMAVVSARKTRLRQLASNGSKGASEALRLAESPTRFLSTVQIGITLIGVLSGAFGGATLSTQLARFLEERLLVSSDVSTAIGVGSVVALITFFSVVFGELIPKQLALHYPEQIASVTAAPMSALSRFAAPLVWLFSTSTEFVVKLLGLEKKGANSKVILDEIKTLVHDGEQEGLLEKNEKMMMERVLTFSEKRITSIMTPARDIVWLDKSKSFLQQFALATSSYHTVFPIADGSLDTLLGTLRTRDICKCTHSKWDDLAPLISQPLYIPETANALQALELFKKTGMQIGFVIDEFGSIQGLVTMTNIIETIVGDLPTDGIPADSPITKRTDGSWLVDGSLPIESFKEHFSIAKVEGEGENLFQTLAGFVMYRLGRVPSAADSFSWGDLRFEVVDMDRNRIDRVLIMPTESLLSSRSGNVPFS